MGEVQQFQKREFLAAVSQALMNTMVLQTELSGFVMAPIISNFYKVIEDQ